MINHFRELCQRQYLYHLFFRLWLKMSYYKFLRNIKTLHIYKSTPQICFVFILFPAISCFWKRINICVIHLTFSEKLITLRAGRGWSQERLAQELGITRQAVGRWEKGSGLPDAKSLMALARVFGVEAEWLLDEDTDAVPQQAGSMRFELLINFIESVLDSDGLFVAAGLLLGLGHRHR